ncbi:Protein FAM111A [Channa argus]|uniref:Protein FAM111A n=1 Tax=Channa argus TaxID=215402 RepID=A0A6G1Q6V4_CHAAH|nr:Protein FAM111A [Channa argus]
MPPPKRSIDGIKDIRDFFEKKSDHPGSSSETKTENLQPGGAAASKTAGCDVKVKKEDDCAMEGHLHGFKVKFSHNDHNVHNIYCDHPRTVLKVIQSTDIPVIRKLSAKHSDETIVIQLGKGDKEKIVPTHFPCSCIEDGESLIVLCNSEKVEDAKDQNYNIVHPRNRYSVFYIDTVGGVHSKTKEIFRSKAFKKYKYLCVYGEKGMTVKEALKRDGRFIDDLGDFNLTDNEDPKFNTHCTQRVDMLDHKVFKIRLNKRENYEKQQENTCASNEPEHKYDIEVIAAAAEKRGVSVKTEIEKRGSDNTAEIYKLLQDQFPGLKEWMESRFPGDSYQEQLKLRKENFGKIQQSFSEVHRVRKLLLLGRSVCKLMVQDVCQGSGFVLFDNFILTNAHLFKSCVEGQNLQEDIDVFALFNYDEPEPKTNFNTFSAKKTFIDFDLELDYAVLELNPQGHKRKPKTKAPKIIVPPGLLKKCGPMPETGEACIIGHPKGEVKEMDPTCIIEKEKRGQAGNDHLHQYKDTIFTLYSICQVLKDKGIEDIMMDGKNAEKVGTYNTFMYHGSSGSPVFDAHCRIFGLHTAGYTYGFPNHEKSVIEFAHPLLSIFERFVGKLKEKGNDELLKILEEEVKGNPYLKKVLNPDLMEVDGE